MGGGAISRTLGVGVRSPGWIKRTEVQLVYRLRISLTNLMRCRRSARCSSTHGSESCCDRSDVCRCCSGCIRRLGAVVRLSDDALFAL